MQQVARRTFELAVAPLAGPSGRLAVRIEGGRNVHAFGDTLPP